MIRKWTKEEDDDNDDGWCIEIDCNKYLCIYIYECVHDMLKKRKWIDVSLLRKEAKRESRSFELLLSVLIVSVIYVCTI